MQITYFSSTTVDLFGVWEAQGRECSGHSLISYHRQKVCSPLVQAYFLVSQESLLVPAVKPLTKFASDESDNSTTWEGNNFWKTGKPKCFFFFFCMSLWVGPNESIILLVLFSWIRHVLATLQCSGNCTFQHQLLLWWNRKGASAPKPHFSFWKFWENEKGKRCNILLSKCCQWCWKNRDGLEKCSEQQMPWLLFWSDFCLPDFTLKAQWQNKASTCYLSPLWAMFPFPSLSPV